MTELINYEINNARVVTFGAAETIMNPEAGEIPPDISKCTGNVSAVSHKYLSKTTSDADNRSEQDKNNFLSLENKAGRHNGEAKRQKLRSWKDQKGAKRYFLHCNLQHVI